MLDYEDKLLLEELRETLLADANAYRRYGRSHRGFQVGCAVLARKPTALGAEESHATFYGHNTKMDPKGSDRCCAEEDALRKARDAGYTAIIAIAVVAPLQRDDESGQLYATTHSCGTCRRMYGKGLYGVEPGTVVLTGQPDKLHISEEHTVLEMCKKHDDGHLFQGT